MVRSKKYTRSKLKTISKKKIQKYVSSSKSKITLKEKTTNIKNARIIIGNASGGVVPDMKTIKKILEENNYKVEVVIYADIKLMKKQSLPIKKYSNTNIQIFIEHVFLENPLETFPSNKSYIFVNQEYIQEWDLDRIRDKTVIPLCKTHYGLNSLKKLNINNVKYVGFGTESNDNDSDNHADTNKISKIPNLFIHIAGSSPLKGTQMLIDTWNTKKIKEPLIITINNNAGGNNKILAYWKSLHPKVKELPENIKVEFELFNKNNLQIPKFENIHNSSIYLYNGILDYEIIKFLQQKATVHMCPSLLEGWGQYIDEGRRAKAIVLILDSPPVNELLNDSSGILVKAYKGPSMKQLVPYGWTQHSSKSGERVGLYMTYKTKVNDLYNGVKRILNMSPEEKMKIGENAYQRSKKDYKDFKAKFSKLLVESENNNNNDFIFI
jgi:hypothetical protein